MKTCPEVFCNTYPCQLPMGHEGEHRYEGESVLASWSDGRCWIASRKCLEMAFGNFASQRPAVGPTAEEIDEEIRKRETPAWLKRASDKEEPG